MPWLLLGLAAVVIVWVQTHPTQQAPQPGQKPLPTPPPGPGPAPAPAATPILRDKKTGLSYPYPPIVNGWRPVPMPVYLGVNGESTQLSPSDVVRVPIQEGSRSIIDADDSQFAYVKMVVLGGTQTDGYTLQMAGQPSTTSKLTLPLPPLSTTFIKVLPRFIHSRTTIWA